MLENEAEDSNPVSEESGVFRYKQKQYQVQYYTSVRKEDLLRKSSARAAGTNIAQRNGIRCALSSDVRPWMSFSFNVSVSERRESPNK